MEWIGTEREPVVTIDGFADDAEVLRAAAWQSRFKPIGEYYPGPRAPVPARYLESIGEVLDAVMREFFSCREGGEVLRSYYSMATTPPNELTLPQRIPHTDAYDDRQIAIIHFLGYDDLGGTAFFRHRSTGFETVNSQRVESYHAALDAEFKQHGEPEPAYIGSDSPFFERIHVSEHRYNRALIYRGKLLHCAALDARPNLPDSLENGRLTVATFVKPHLSNRQANPS